MKTLLLAAVALSAISAVYSQQTCAGRGGCTCDCGWANSQTCQVDDGSCCFACCCSSGPPPPPPPSGNGTLYCPSANDIITAYTASGWASIRDGGWTIGGGAAVATKAAFNLLGGSVEWDADFTGSQPGVNSNIYSISPGFGSGDFNQGAYCDGQGSLQGHPWCLEVDWIESNGNCAGQTTLHSTFSGLCNTGGCMNQYAYNGQAAFHMKVTFDQSGQWTTYRNGQVIGPTNLNPTPDGSSWQIVADTYRSKGAVVYSSQWTGWVPPVGGCYSGQGNLGASKFSISNLKIQGIVTQGPEPTKC